MTLPSYLCERWFAPEAGPEASVIVDASTGVEVCRLATDGYDPAAVLDHARRVGHASLATMTFPARARALKRMAQALDARKDELYARAAEAGATRRDAAIDVDGGIGVLFTYASKGRRALPSATVLVDGPAEALSKDGTFLGRHIHTSLPGAMLQINAFNFPTWGPLEKFAPAFLAGLPSVIKPATPTAQLTEAWVRILVEADLLPAGTLQLVSGPIPGMLERLDTGDVVAFTGSASTASRLRGQTPDGVRFTAETDSINASVLGEDVEAGSATFTAYVRQLLTELTAKAGQKCTAIRRAIVPEDRMDAVADALRTLIDERVVIGDPRGDGVTLGPVVSLAQRDEVMRGVRRLIDAGGRVVIGSTAAPEVVRADGSRDTVPEGAFVAPVVLAFGADAPPAVHEVEAFGPVTSLIGYRGVEQAARLVAAGGGSLVTSVATDDPATARELVGRIASGNGRVLILDESDARTSTGHGTPVPHLVHGGPGRAGGGEELGGMRAVRNLMQRTAIQGSPTMLTAVTGLWHPGAPVFSGGEHPFRMPLARLRPGTQIVSEARTVTLEDIETFAAFTGDTFYAHMDEDAAAANPFFPGRVAHGYLLISFAAGLFVDPAPGPVLANEGVENLRFTAPVSPGESIHVVLTAKQITPREDADYGQVRWDAVIRNQDDVVVAAYDVLTLVAKD